MVRCKLEVGVITNASSNEITGWQEGTLKIKLIVPPEGGRANKLLIKYLSHRLSLSKRSITIISGERSPCKIIEITGLNRDEIKMHLNL